MQRDLVVVILHGIYNFILVTDTTVQNNDNEISLHFKRMRLIFMNYSVLFFCAAATQRGSWPPHS
jgi:hypothetical protein